MPGGGGAEELIASFRRVHLLPCLASPGSVRVVAEVEADLEPALPYLNAVLPGAIYDRASRTLTLRQGGTSLCISPHRVTISGVPHDAWEQHLEEVRRRINDTWRRRAEITPSWERRHLLQPSELVKLLPGTNCGACGEANCLLFALRLLAGQTSLLRCAPLFEPSRARQREELLRRLAEAGYPVPSAFR